MNASDFKILYITLGCAKNEVDTDRMRSLLNAAGYKETKTTDDCSLVIVNTCSFLASATSESIETTLELANDVADGIRSCPIVMCGCVPSRYGDDLPSELPEVAAFVKADEEDAIVGVVDGVLGVTRSIPLYLPQVKRTVEGAVAYVKISDGCDRFCSFCMIPYIRGRYHSRSAREILAEVKELCEGGVREIVLIGQDTGIWGTDFDQSDDHPHSLPDLLRKVAESLGFAATASHVGETAEVIVDGVEDTEDGQELIGHAWFQAPDSDGAVHLDIDEASVGDILNVEFTDSFCYELVGHVAD